MGPYDRAGTGIGAEIRDPKARAGTCDDVLQTISQQAMALREKTDALAMRIGGPIPRDVPKEAALDGPPSLMRALVELQHVLGQAIMNADRALDIL